jgi:hypothetical protein
MYSKAADNMSCIPPPFTSHQFAAHSKEGVFAAGGQAYAFAFSKRDTPV